MSDAQAIGDVVEGALKARTVEPHAGEHASAQDPGHTHETACLNCATPLVGSYCHACGQAAHVHRTLGAFFHDLLHGVFHFEGKIWRTLPMLVWRPGELTRRYIDGQRARFVSPLALFLFSVFLAFAVYHQTAGETNFAGVPTNAADAAKAERKIEQKIAALEAERDRLQSKGADTDAIDQQIDAQQTGLEIVREVRSNSSGPEIDSNLQSDIGAVNAAIKKFKANPALVAYKAQNYAYKYSWALIPISVPFLWLLFPFSRRFHLYDHTVFVTYSLGFMTLLGVTIMLLSVTPLEGAIAVLVFVPPFHMYRQLRGAYGTSRFGGIVRTFALSVFACIALMLFVILIAAESGA
ncbi:DUF3667 domain-containing protein [Novosphingobium huizhouense]|uniref:DUF3667 domain-containing protein n=1 Tax=Novosphingobium huizhouense TaxID=2866625 RepID=UPI001CD90B8E|nr:DUF3667 domain-containing protein [Novosphingobium huizhouense]